MESTNNGLSNHETLGNTGGMRDVLPLSPFQFYSDFSPVDSEGDLKSLEGGLNYHQRCSSESFLIEEQPSWLDDLLNEPETPLHRGHRRAASDSYAYFGEADKFTLPYDQKNNKVFFFFLFFLFRIYEIESNTNLLIGTCMNEDGLFFFSQESKVVPSLGLENSRGESGSENLQNSADRANGSQVKPSGSKMDSKRSKQHNAHRSRVRKLQYISHLERTVQILKAEGFEISAELEFVEQQNIILSMENRTLRQRLESISQEQMIKHWEQGMLEREIGRLQTLYHMQKQQQMQMQMHHQQQHPHNQHQKHRRNRSRDLDHPVNISSTKNKDASSSKDSVNGSVRV
ncbi:PREDICTED: uncharacterized protein At4g06598 isoform X2 [Erythranthe guttata]|nr:PREDICTED: uncharacterized protein At4g06598 isoform X2 [Erythranthe guttata]|eukprot:XP_012855003.1 PREDICTED: uncharacterized protein At4g06598 isoform X2 [Erythranthe guttata]